MTDTVKQEFMRLVYLLPQTDPRTEAYHILLSSIERFDAIGSTINDMVEAVNREKYNVAPVIPFTAPDFPEPVPPVEETITTMNPPVDTTAPPPAEQISSSEVRKLLVEARGRGVNVKEILQGFGADSFQALPSDKYDALAAALRAV